MNNDFLSFIEKDIDAKKTLITTMPIKTKTNKRKLNEKIEETKEKYEEYKMSVRNYLLAKSRSFNIKSEETNSEELSQKVTNLEHVKFLLNPSNTYFEKMGFDNLLYLINNYYIFNFNSLTDIINQFLDKFDLVGIHLHSDDFGYTCYVHEYMSSFLEVRYKKTDSYRKTSEIFEQIYWHNPEIIEHIELNFRKLIRQNERKFENYILKLQKEVMSENKIKNYVDCLEKLQGAYIELNLANKEDVGDIISLAKLGTIDINHYLDDSKVKSAAYSSLLSDKVDKNDERSMKKVYPALEKLKVNIDEYNNYIEFTPLIEDFKEEYEKMIPLTETKKFEYKELKKVESEIENKENELEKINKKIFSGKPGLFEFKNDNALKQLKIESIQKAKELYELYKKYDSEYFKEKVLTILNRALCISDLLNLYYSYDYFKKLAIKRVYNITTYEEIIKYSESFDLFAMDFTNIIVNGVLLFGESNIAKVIANKYHLNNINLTEDDLSPENLKSLTNKIMLLLRMHKIEESKTTVEKIWFMVQVEKIIEKENKK